MANAKNTKIIRVYGVTLAKPEYRTRPYGHGATQIKGYEGGLIEYVDYFIEDLVVEIKRRGLQKRFIKLIKEND